MKRYEKYRPRGKFKYLNDPDKRKSFTQSQPDEYIMRQREQLADYLNGFGVSAAQELLLMLSAWLADPENEKQAAHYFEQLGER